MWNKFSEIKKKAVEGLNTATNVAAQMAKDIIKENMEQRNEEEEVEDRGGLAEQVLGKQDVDQSLYDKMTDQSVTVPQTSKNGLVNSKESKKMAQNDAMNLKNRENSEKSDEKHKIADGKNIADQDVILNSQDQKDATIVEDEHLDDTITDLSNNQKNTVIEVESASKIGNDINSLDVINKDDQVEENALGYNKESQPANDTKNASLEESEQTIVKEDLTADKLRNISAENKNQIKEKMGTNEVQEASGLDKPVDEVLQDPTPNNEVKANIESQQVNESTSNQPSDKSMPSSLSLQQQSKDSSPEPSKTQSPARKVQTENSSPARAMQTQRSSHTHDMTASRDVCRDHLNQIEKLSREKSDMISDIGTLTNQLMAVKTEGSESKAKMKSFESHIQALSSQLADLKKQNTAAVNKKDKEIGLLTEEAKLYKERIRTLQAWCDEVAKKDREKDADRSKREKEKGVKEKTETEKWQKEAEKLTREVAEAKALTTKVEAEKVNVQNELNKARDTMDRLQEIVDNNEDERVSLEDELKKNRSFNEELKKEREKSTKEIALLKEQLKSSKDDVLRANFAIQEKEKEFMGVAEEREKLKKEAAELIEKIRNEQKNIPIDTDHLVL